MPVDLGLAPDLAAVRAYLRVSATAVTDDDLERVRATALTDQAARCYWPAEDYPAALAQALLRRVARELAARGLPLGMVGVDSEFGSSRLPAWDAVIEEHERAFRVPVLG